MSKRKNKQRRAKAKNPNPPTIKKARTVWREGMRFVLAAVLTLSVIGVIIGEGHDDLITEAQLAAQKHGVELRIRISSSDQETLYLFRRMVQDIDGFWLFPDNRVLSPRVLRDMLAQANRHHVPVAVSHEAMLSMGAAISVSSVAADIASTIVDVLRRIEAGRIDDIPPLTGLSEVRVVTNDELLKRYLSADTQGDGT